MEAKLVLIFVWISFWSQYIFDTIERSCHTNSIAGVAATRAVFIVCAHLLEVYHTSLVLGNIVERPVISFTGWRKIRRCEASTAAVQFCACGRRWNGFDAFCSRIGIKLSLCDAFVLVRVSQVERVGQGILVFTAFYDIAFLPVVFAVASILYPPVIVP